MKKVFPLILSLLFIAGPFTYSYSQTKDDKKKEKMEKKLWGQKAKTYKKAPIQLRDDLENLNKQIKDLSAKNKELMSRISACNSQVDSLNSVLASKVNEIAALTSKYEKLQAAYEAQKNVTEKNILPGLVYKVQIGAFVHFDINKYLKDTDNFEGETKDGMNKYTLGGFKDFEMAEAFQKDIKILGIKDAWVVPFIDGVRVTHDEAKKFLEKQGAKNP